MTDEQIKQEEKEIFERWLKQAEAGDARCQWLVGECYYYGYGVEVDDVEAVKWYTKAAEQGYTAAQYELGERYNFGLGVEADDVEAVKWYQKAAEQGHDWAQSELGNCYQYGWGVEENKAEAVKWYTKAAEQGHANAQYQLGLCYFIGLGVEKDETEAVKWYKKAASSGNKAALRALLSLKSPLTEAERLFLEGLDVIDDSERFEKSKQAAELGECYEYGQGVEKDLVKAIELFEKATLSGEDCHFEIERCREKLAIKGERQ